MPTVGFVSLGCPKALVDSERILTQLRAEGYGISGDYAEADVVVVNTCGFIDAAVQESLDAIGEALHENGKVIVTGCLGGKPADGKALSGEAMIRQLHPKVLAVTGPHATAEVLQAIHTEIPRPHDPFMDLVPDQGLRLTPDHYAYLKISEGCNHRCSFCIIPSMRGDLDSRSIGEVMREAEALVKAGVKEILVISQDTSAYGVDLKYRTDFVNGRPVRTRFTELVKELSQLDVWTRLHYVYPYPHIDEVLEFMVQPDAQRGLLPYLDVPFQHSHPEVLKRMKRPANGEKTLERLQAWRRAVPHLTLRSTFIAGFPGETEAQFDHLLDFLTEAQIDRLGCFAYSPVDGAAANQLVGALPDELREERCERVMAHQQPISEQRLARWVGTRAAVLIDEVDEEEGCLIARSAADAPEIDGIVRVYPDPNSRHALEVEIGGFLQVDIVDHDETDLVAMATSR